MGRSRDPILIAAAALVLVAALYGSIAASTWIGRPFAGFLLLENGLVPSAGLAHWPAVSGGEIYQQELVSIDGRPLSDPAALQEHARRLPVGSEVAYRFRDGNGDGEVERIVATRTFTGLDFTLLYGSFLVCGIGLAGVALVIRFLRPDDPAARGSAISLWLIGMWALSALDLYGPFRMFRLHALAECLLFAGTFHLALVMPTPRGIALRKPWVVAVPYGVAAVLAAVNQAGLHDPAVYTATHRIAMNAFGIAAFSLIGCLLWTYFRPPTFEARQRVKVLALGSVAALAPQVLLSVSSAASGGRAPENLLAWSGIFFPIAIAYAVLRSDLLQVDAILRRTVNYALLTVLVALSYAGVVVLLEPLISPSGRPSRWLSETTLALLAVFVLLPLRDRLQSLVDRVFFRSAYDFRRIVAETSAKLAAVTDLDVVREEIENAVRYALQPESLVLQAASPGKGELEGGWLAPYVDGESAVDGRRVTEQVGGGLRVAFVSEGRLVATMVVGRALSGRIYSGDDRRFLETLSNQGAIAIQNALAMLRLQELNLTLEQKVQERTSELAAALQELQQTQSQMVHQEKMASIGQLVAGVAHEINNPLNFIQGNLFHLREYAGSMQRALSGYEAAVREESPKTLDRLATVRKESDIDYLLDDLDSVLEGCDEGVRRATTIVKDLRAFSRIDGGEQGIVDVQSAVDSTLNLLRGHLARIEVRREYEDVPTIECIKGQIDQVVMNLIANAADAIGETGVLTVRIRPEGADHVVIEVEDDGCGIDPGNLEKVFEPFFTTKEVGKGTGLGLAISYGVVARHGGRIDVESRPGEGTCFRVQLPLKMPGVPTAAESDEN